MAKLEYTFKNSTLFRMLFEKYPDLLKNLVAELLKIRYESIEQFEIQNTEMPLEILGYKFCQLDINMTVNGQRVDLEFQINNKRDYPEGSNFYWARVNSTALGESEKYSKLPRTVIISIFDFEMFDCADYHSEYQALEVTRHTQLKDRMSLHYFELPKLPKELNANDRQELWLKLLNAETEEEIAEIEAMKVPIMQQAIEACRSIIATLEYQEIERMRSNSFKYWLLRFIILGLGLIILFGRTAAIIAIGLFSIYYAINNKSDYFIAIFGRDGARVFYIILGFIVILYICLR